MDAKTRYLPLEKVALALIYSVYVLTELPLQALLRRSNFIGITAKWGATLGAFNIKNIYWKTLLPSIRMGRQSPKGIRMEHSLRIRHQPMRLNMKHCW